MQLLEEFHSIDQIESVIDIAVALADYTLDPDKCREIPVFLAGVLGLADVTVGVVRHAHTSWESSFIMWDASVPSKSGEATLAEQRCLLEYFRHLKPLHLSQGGAARAHEAARWSDKCSDIPGIPNATLFIHSIDWDHSLLFMVRSLDPEVEASDRLRVIVRELAKQLYCLIAWYQRHLALGRPFSLLTEQEWVVLRGLTSEASEKQLANQLALRPHTLHSRIKSIYKKAKVQGRVPLIQKFNAAIVQFRIQSHKSTVACQTACHS